MAASPRAASFSVTRMRAMPAILAPGTRPSRIFPVSAQPWMAGARSDHRAASEADPALPVGAARLREPQDAASASMSGLRVAAFGRDGVGDPFRALVHELLDEGVELEVVGGRTLQAVVPCRGDDGDRRRQRAPGHEDDVVLVVLPEVLELGLVGLTAVGVVPNGDIAVLEGVDDALVPW